MRTARLRAAAISVSWLAIVTRTLTPERWLTSDERRASCDSSATISRMKPGTSTGTDVAAASSNDVRSASTMAISTSGSSG